MGTKTNAQKERRKLRDQITKQIDAKYAHRLFQDMKALSIRADARIAVAKEEAKKERQGLVADLESFKAEATAQYNLLLRINQELGLSNAAEAAKDAETIAGLRKEVALLDSNQEVRWCLESGRDFVFFTEDDPGYIEAYRARRQLKLRAGVWTAENEAAFNAALSSWLKKAPFMER